MALDIESVLDSGVKRQEARRFEALPSCAFTPSCRSC